MWAWTKHVAKFFLLPLRWLQRQAFFIVSVWVGTPDQGSGPKVVELLFNGADFRAAACGRFTPTFDRLAAIYSRHLAWVLAHPFLIDR